MKLFVLQDSSGSLAQYSGVMWATLGHSRRPPKTAVGGLVYCVGMRLFVAIHFQYITNKWY